MTFGVAGRVEVYEIVGTRSGDGVDEDVGKVSVRIEDCNASIGVDVSRRKALKQGRFSCAGLAEYVGVSKKVAR